MKTKITRPAAGRYLRELSIVILGVAVTLMATGWINKRIERKDIKLYLSAIKLELENNLLQVESKVRYFERLKEFWEEAEAAGEEDILTDETGKELGMILITTYYTSAFEMFKSSGVMRLVKDKKLLNSIWQSYGYLEFSQVSMNAYMDRKTDEIYLHMLTEGVLDLQLDINKPNRLMTFLRLDMGIGDILYVNADEIRKTLALLEDYLS